jgi:hypothetical protein
LEIIEQNKFIKKIKKGGVKGEGARKKENAPSPLPHFSAVTI